MPGEISKYLYTDEEMRPLYSRVAKSFNYAEVNLTLYRTQNADNLNIIYLHTFMTGSVMLNLGYINTQFYTLAIWKVIVPVSYKYFDTVKY